MKNADDVVHVVLVDRQDAVTTTADLLEELMPRGVRRDSDEFGTWHHGLARRQIGEVEDAVEHLLFLFFEDAGLLAGRHQHLQLLFRVHEGMAAGSMNTNQVRDGASSGVQQTNKRPERSHEELGGFD